MAVVSSFICDTHAKKLWRQTGDTVATGMSRGDSKVSDNSLKALLTDTDKPLRNLDFKPHLPVSHAVSLSKRQLFDQLGSQDVDHHWHCNTSVTWKDLGVLHYPRFVREVTCSTMSCMHGFYICRSQIYQIRVLTVRNEDEEEEITVPISLRQDWKFTEVAVSVGCLCTT